jgi:tight adherence protein C
VELVVPALIFTMVLLAGVILARRADRTLEHLARHEIAAGPGGATVAAPQLRTAILSGMPHPGAVGKVAALAARREVKTKAAKLLLEAGNPMPLGTFLLLRMVMLFGVTPLFLLIILRGQGITPRGIVMAAVGLLVLPNMPMVMVKRKARKRAHAIELAMPDALDLLVVCVEGGLSLDGGLQQVSQRTEGILAGELRRLLGEISTGVSRRDAFQALAARSQSQSLAIFATAIIQADKMGTSIASTLRTLAETMRTRRRQAAETQARKAPIKMLPFLVFFMIPSLFIVILGPTVLAIMDFFASFNQR